MIKNKAKGLFALIAFVLMSTLSQQAISETLQGRVVGVSDGDTVTVLDASKRRHKIRLSGIDAPEKAQPFGQRSKENLSRLVFGRDVNIVWRKRDRYKRIVGKVMVADPSCKDAVCPKTFDACEAQITVGLAWWYVRYAKEQNIDDARRYKVAQKEARASKVGLWSEPKPISPWKWRHTKK